MVLGIYNFVCLVNQWFLILASVKAGNITSIQCDFKALEFFVNDARGIFSLFPELWWQKKSVKICKQRLIFHWSEIASWKSIMKIWTHIDFGISYWNFEGLEKRFPAYATAYSNWNFLKFKTIFCFFTSA